MANFEVKVVSIDRIEEHPNADAIELAHVGGFVSIVRKGTFQAGDLAVYIPEASVMPDWLIKLNGLWNEEKDKGNLAGKLGNRVKAVRLRGVVSQGILHRLRCEPMDQIIGWVLRTETQEMWVSEGDELSEELDISKYEPPIPTCMAGEVCNLHGYTLHYDIENIQKFPDVLREGEKVVITEKLHGTWTCIGVYPGLKNDELLDGCLIITSKGMSEQGLGFKWNDTNQRNLYVRMFNNLFHGDTRRLLAAANGKPLYILGETFGPGVQDLHYGKKDIEFRGFDVYVGNPGQGRYLDWNEKSELLGSLSIGSVPTIFVGDYSEDGAIEIRDGHEVLSGSKANIREGIVITPLEERRDTMLGRVILKWVSPDYLLRKNKNATEFN